MISFGRTHGSSRAGGANRWRSNEQAKPERHPSTVRGASRKLARAMQGLARNATGRALSLPPPARPTEPTLRTGRTQRRGQANRSRQQAEGSRRFQPRLPTAVLLWLALAWVASNLTLVALRSDLTRVRYDLSHASALLGQLDEESRALTLELRKLYDPRRLREIALARGFGPPERIVELP